MGKRKKTIRNKELLAHRSDYRPAFHTRATASFHHSVGDSFSMPARISLNDISDSSLVKIKSQIYFLAYHLSIPTSALQFGKLSDRPVLL